MTSMRHLTLSLLTVATLAGNLQAEDPLLSKDLQVRKDAMISLARDQDVAKCQRLLASDNFALRKAAVFALARLNTPGIAADITQQATTALKSALADDSFIIRFEAARTLGRWGVSDGEPILVDALAHTNPLRRRQSAEALFFVGSSKSIKNLIYNLTDADYTVRRSSIEALRKITGQNFGYVSVDPRYLPMEFDQRKELLALRSELLEELNTDQNPEDLKQQRFEAMDKVSQEFKRAIDARAVEMIDRRRVAIRGWKDWWLSNKTGERIDWLVTGLEHENADTRRISALSLGDMQAISAHDAIINKLEDDDTDVTVAACRALAKLNQKDSLPALIEMMASHEDADRTEKGRLIRSYAAYQALLGMTQANYSSLSRVWKDWWERSEDFFEIGRDLPHGDYNVRVLSRSGNSITFEVRLYHHATKEWFVDSFTENLGDVLGESEIEHTFTISGREFTRLDDMRPGLVVQKVLGDTVILKVDDEKSGTTYTLRLP